MKKLIIVLILMIVSSVFAKLNCYEVTWDKSDDSTLSMVTFKCVDVDIKAYIESTFFIMYQEIVLFKDNYKINGKSFELWYIKESGNVVLAEMDEFGIKINEEIPFRFNKKEMKDLLMYKWNKYKVFLKK